MKPEIPDKIISLCEAIPHYVQYLASAAWEEAQENDSVLDYDVLEKAVSRILTNQIDYFMKQYEELTAEGRYHLQRVGGMILDMVK